MRVTHIFKTYFPDTQGGLEEAIRQISKCAIKEGIPTTVISLSKNPRDLIQDGVKTKSYYSNFNFLSNPFSWSLTREFSSIVENSDIIHLQFPWPTGELLTLLFNIKKPIVLTFHCDIHNNSFFKKLYTPFIRAILKKSDVIVPTSENLLNSTSILKPFRSKCKVVNLWIDEERFETNPSPSEETKALVEKIIDFGLFVGVLRWYKGLDVLLDAAKKQAGNIVIVGKGPLLKKLLKRISDENISNVFIVGFKSDDDVKYLLMKSKFFVLPSISPAEAFGQVLLEASYYCKPMITTELGTGTSYVNLHGVTGEVVEANNVEELSASITKLFDNVELCDFYGRNAYKRLFDNFTMKKQAQKYIEIYKELV